MPPTLAPAPHLLDRDALGDHIDRLHRAAWAMCGSREDAEDLVQETVEQVLRRPRRLRGANEIGYLLHALRNTYASRYRVAVRKPRVDELLEDEGLTTDEARSTFRKTMEAVAGVPAHYRDAVIAVDLVGLSYREAARILRTREATITTRLHRGRQLIAHALTDSEEGPPEK